MYHYCCMGRRVVLEGSAEDNGTLSSSQSSHKHIRKRRMGVVANKSNHYIKPPSSSSHTTNNTKHQCNTEHRDQATIRKLRTIPQLAKKAHHNDPNAKLEAAKQFRKLLSVERNPPIQEVIESGIVPKLVEFLKDKQNPKLIVEAAWALTNIASGTSLHTREVINCGAISHLVDLLNDSTIQESSCVKEQAVWALGNIAGDSAECRDLVLKENIMEPLLDLFGADAKLTMIRNATWTLSNLCRGKPQPAFQQVVPALPVLAHLLFSKDDEVLADACWALSYISDDNGPENTKIQAVVRAGVCRRLVELLFHRSNDVKTPALRTIGNVVTGDDLQTQLILNCNCLAGLKHLLENEKKGIRKEACWTISNITAGNRDQIQQVLNARIFPILINLLRTAEFDIKKEAVWALFNATSGGSPDQIRYLVYQGCIGPLCDLLECSDSKTVVICLEALENILKVGELEIKSSESSLDSQSESITNPELASFRPNVYARWIEECGGLDKLELIQYHENVDVYLRVSTILKHYFDADEQELDGDSMSEEQFDTSPRTLQS